MYVNAAVMLVPILGVIMKKIIIVIMLVGLVLLSLVTPQVLYANRPLLFPGVIDYSGSYWTCWCDKPYSAPNCNCQL